MATSNNQFVELWRRLSISQRATVIGALVATLALIGAVIFYGSQPDYAVLFTDLRPADAQQIVDKLKATQIPYKLSENGTTINVPSERVGELRVEMAASGTLSASHVGFDIFDKNSFGATDFTQQVNYQRALEGELARTLEGMKEVESARVHITRSRESVFTDKVEPAKASVMLGLKSRELAADRTEAIVSLVASAVEGLDPENISVMDSEGRLLTGSQGKKGIKGGAGFDSLMEARHKFEADSAEQITALLEPVTGPGHVRANVTADIDFDQVEQMEENFDPKSVVVRSQQTSQEYKNSPSGSGGVAGTRANDPTAPAETKTAGSAAGNGRTATTTTYEISKVTKRTVANGGRVTRLSVSVLVDSNLPMEGVETAKIQELVTAAIGIDKARGDLLAVQMIPFQQPALIEPSANVSWLERNREIVKTGIKYGVLVFVALLLMIMVVRPARRALRQAATPKAQLLLPPADERQHYLPASQMDTPRTVAELEAAVEAESVAKAEPVAVALSRPKETAATMRRNQVVGYSKDEPEKVAMAVRNWLQKS